MFAHVCEWVNATSALSPLWQTQCHRNVLGHFAKGLYNRLSVCEWLGDTGGVILGRQHEHHYTHTHIKEEDSTVFLSHCYFLFPFCLKERDRERLSHSCILSPLTHRKNKTSVIVSLCVSVHDGIIINAFMFYEECLWNAKRFSACLSIDIDIDCMWECVVCVCLLLDTPQTKCRVGAIEQKEKDGGESNPFPLITPHHTSSLYVNWLHFCRTLWKLWFSIGVKKLLQWNHIQLSLRELSLCWAFCLIIMRLLALKKMFKNANYSTAFAVNGNLLQMVFVQWSDNIFFWQFCNSLVFMY